MSWESTKELLTRAKPTDSLPATYSRWSQTQTTYRFLSDEQIKAAVGKSVIY